MAQLDRETLASSGATPLEQTRATLSSMGAGAAEKVKEVVAASREKMETLKKKNLEELYTDAKTFVRENPGKSLVGGLIAGFLLGRLLRRR